MNLDWGLWAQSQGLAQRLGFRVSGLGGIRFRVSGLEGIRFRVHDLGDQGSRL